MSDSFSDVPCGTNYLTTIYKKGSTKKTKISFNYYKVFLLRMHVIQFSNVFPVPKVRYSGLLTWTGGVHGPSHACTSVAHGCPGIFHVWAMSSIMVLSELYCILNSWFCLSWLWHDKYCGKRKLRRHLAISRISRCSKMWIHAVTNMPKGLRKLIVSMR